MATPKLQTADLARLGADMLRFDRDRPVGFFVIIPLPTGAPSYSRDPLPNGCGCNRLSPIRGKPLAHDVDVALKAHEAAQAMQQPTEQHGFPAGKLPPGDL